MDSSWPQAGAFCTEKVLEYFSEGEVLIRYRSDSKEIRGGYAPRPWPQPLSLTRLNCSLLDHSSRALHGQQTESLTKELTQDWIMSDPITHSHHCDPKIALAPQTCTKLQHSRAGCWLQSVQVWRHHSLMTHAYGYITVSVIYILLRKKYRISHRSSEATK